MSREPYGQGPTNDFWAPGLIGVMGPHVRRDKVQLTIFKEDVISQPWNPHDNPSTVILAKDFMKFVLIIPHIRTLA